MLVWIHGGALIMGSRNGVPKQLLDLCRTDGFVLVSLDYRLAPEVKLPAIIEDVKDAFRWIREQGPKQFHVDPDKMVRIPERNLAGRHKRFWRQDRAARRVG